MKKIICLFMLMIFMSSFVAAAIHPVVGNVIADGQGVSDAYVTVNCNSIAKSTSSVSGGVYAVEYTDIECPDGSIVYVDASKDSYYGSSSGKMHDFTVLTIAIVDVFIYKVMAILEPLRIFQKISVPNIKTDDVVIAGDYLNLVINTENTGDKDMSDVTVSVVVAELALRKSVKISKLKEGKDTTKEIKLFIPSDTLPGVYDIRITISNDHTKRVKHRSFRVI